MSQIEPSCASFTSFLFSPLSFLVLAQETTFLYIPNSAVGAIIGTRGSHIRNIIRFSGASVKITSLPEGTPSEPQAERKVTIVGTPEAQWKVPLDKTLMNR